jgi:hypothetical protein
VPAKSPEARALSASIAATTRWHPDRDTTDLARDLRAARLEEHIRAAVDAAPPLTAEQRDRLAQLLRGAPAAGAA